MGHGAQAIAAELLNVVRRHDAAQDDGAAQVLVREVIGVGQVTQEAAREAVAGAGGVRDLLDGVGGRDEDVAVVLDEHGAVLALLDDDGLGTKLEDALGGLEEVVGLAELTRLALVEQGDVDPLEGLDQRSALARDPEVHGVADHELGALHLVEHQALELGIDVTQEEVLALGVGLGELGLEVREDVQVRHEGVRRVEVLIVEPLPAEGLALDPLQALDVDAAAAEQLDVLFGEVGADNAHEVDGREEARRHGGVGGGSAERLDHFSARRPDRIQRDRSDDGDVTHY
ncbi:hypothetical protein D3C86_1161530 [compost metagenome]